MNGETIYGLLFYFISAIILISAILAMSLRNLVHAALFLAVSFISIAGLYVLLQADFLAGVQILIYGGAVPVLIVFGIMLTRTPGEQSNPWNAKRVYWGGAAALLVLAVFGLFLCKAAYPLQEAAFKETAIEGIARLLFGDFLIPFEISAVLLLAALLGAIILSRGGSAE